MRRLTRRSNRTAASSPRTAFKAENAAEAARLEQTKVELGPLAVDPDRLAALRELDRHLRERNLAPSDLEPFVEAAGTLAELADVGGKDASILGAILVGELAEAITSKAGEDESPETAVWFLADVAVKGGRAREACDALEAEGRALEVPVKKARKELSALKMTITRQSRRKAAGEIDLARLTTQAAEEQRVLTREREKRAAVRREHRVLRGEIDFAKELYVFLCGNVGPYDTLWQYLGAIRDLRAGGLPPTHVYLRKLTAHARRRVIEILQRTVSDDLVPRWELDRWRETARREAEAALRAEQKAVSSPAGEGV